MIKKIVFLLVFIISCSENKIDTVDNCNEVLISEKQIESLAYSYDQNPTSENCNAYVTELNRFIYYAERCSSIPNTTINEFKEILEAISCE